MDFEALKLWKGRSGNDCRFREANVDEQVLELIIVRNQPPAYRI